MDTIVLRSNKPIAVPAPGAVPMRRPVGAVPHQPNEVSASVQSLTGKQRLDLHRDPQVFGLAPVLPTTLIAPVAPGAQPGAGVSAAPAVSWGIEAVRADRSTATGAGITVAVLDTGIDKTHPAFQGVQIETRNFTAESDEDIHGHGTHCAGTIFGRTVNGTRTGVAPGVERALIGKVLGQGGGSTGSLVEAVNWAWASGARVISMSLGVDLVGYQTALVQGGLPSAVATSMALAGYRANVRIFDRLSKLIVDSGEGMQSAVIVAATGNESDRDRAPNYLITLAPPAAGESFLSVAALGPPDAGSPGKYNIASFSNIGGRIAAPGVAIWSARRGGGLVAMDGTSMATPHVAGVAALWAQRLMQQPQGQQFNAASVVRALERSAMELPHLSVEDVGLGLVQAP